MPVQISHVGNDYNFLAPMHSLTLYRRIKIGVCALWCQIKMAPHVSNLVRHVLTAGKALCGQIRWRCTMDFIELSPAKIKGRSWQGFWSFRKTTWPKRTMKISFHIHWATSVSLFGLIRMIFLHCLAFLLFHLLNIDHAYLQHANVPDISL